jgi:hypothetical protein
LTAPDERAAVALDRPRDLGTLLSDSFSLYRRHFWTFLAIAIVIVVPVHAIVLGVGLGQFSGGYDSTDAPASAIIPTLMQFLVVGPLVAVTVLHAVQEIAAGKKPGFGRSLQAGLDAFTPVFWPVLIAVLCEIGVAITVIGPLVLLVRLYFVPQLVVLDGKRGVDALRASWELTRGFGWRTAAMLLVGYFAYGLAGALITTPLAALARSADSEAVSLAAGTLGETLVAAPIGIFATLLYFDLRSRKAALAR